jgi:ketosteroid isomerase-like protein
MAFRDKPQNEPNIIEDSMLIGPVDAGDQRMKRVIATLESFRAAYESGSQEYFDFFREDASVFSVSSPTRLDGREAYRKTFGPQIGLQRRAKQVLNPEVQFLGDCALVTCHNRIRVNYNSVDARVTIVLVPEGDNWRIAHFHMSPLIHAPAATDTQGLIEDVTALAESAGQAKG